MACWFKKLPGNFEDLGKFYKVYRYFATFQGIIKGLRETWGWKKFSNNIYKDFSVFNKI